MWIADWADLSFSGGTYPSPGCRSPGQVRVGLSTSSQRLQSQVLWAPHGRRGPCSLEMSPGAAGTAWRPGGSQPRAGAPNKLLPNLLRPNSGLAPPRKWAEPTCPAPRQVRTNSFHPCCLHLTPRHLLSTPPPPLIALAGCLPTSFCPRILICTGSLAPGTIFALGRSQTFIL